MSKKQCYFKCDNKGVLYGFPPATYNSYEKYLKWKTVLRKQDQEKDDHFIASNIKLCSNHFESYYITQANRLTRHAIPTLNIASEPTAEQDELLCTFIEENPEVINTYNEIDELKRIESKWKEWTPRLNAYGQNRSYNSWAEYLCQVMSKLRTKKVEWMEGPKPGMQLVRNNQDFTDLELKMLHVWSKTSVSPCPSPQDMEEEYVIDLEDSGDSERINETVIVTLNVEADGPLLEAADIAPSEQCKGSRRLLNKDCIHCNDEEPDRFDVFGKQIAQQLRCMPLEMALETQRLLLSVLRSKRARILNNTFL